MLQLTGSIGFCVNIGDLFQLQRPFEGDGILIAASKEQRVVFVREILSQRFDTLILRKHLLNAARQRLQAMHDLVFDSGVLAFEARQFRHQHQQNGQLRSEGFGRGDADFRSGVGHHRQIGFTHQRGTRHITNRQRAQIAQLFRQAQTGQRICRFA